MVIDLRQDKSPGFADLATPGSTAASGVAAASASKSRRVALLL
jgi:hypothetical protein